jgi:hypothetical protein
MRRIRGLLGFALMLLTASAFSTGASVLSESRAGEHSGNVSGLTPAAVPSANATSQNWAGVEASIVSPRYPFLNVSTSFVVPRLRCDGNYSAVSIWPGIDGYSDSANLDQTGVIGECEFGRATWSVFWQTDPNVANNFPSSIKSGDGIVASVGVDPTGGSTASFGIWDETSGQSWSFTGYAPYGIPAIQGECVVEAPTEPDGKLAPLANFGSVTFTQGCIGTSRDLNYSNLIPVSCFLPGGEPYDPCSGGYLNMVRKHSVLKGLITWYSTVAVTAASAGQFTVTWKRPS